MSAIAAIGISVLGSFGSVTIVEKKHHLGTMLGRDLLRKALSLYTFLHTLSTATGDRVSRRAWPRREDSEATDSLESGDVTSLNVFITWLRRIWNRPGPGRHRDWLLCKPNKQKHIHGTPKTPLLAVHVPTIHHMDHCHTNSMSSAVYIALLVIIFSLSANALGLLNKLYR